MRKLLVLLNTLDLGGSQTYVLTLCKELAKRGYKITVAAKGGILSKEASKYVEKVIDCRIDAAFRWPLNSNIKKFFRVLFLYFPACLSIINLCRKEKFDCILTQQPSPTFLALVLRKIYGVHVVYIVHHFLPNEFPPLLFKKLRYRLPSIVAISEEIKRYLIKYWNIPDYKITVIVNCIDLDNFQYQSIKKVQQKTVVYMSSLNEAKKCAIDNFINAALIVEQKFKNIEFRLIGNGSLFNKYSLMVKKINDRIGHEVVKLTGGQVDVKQFIQNADVFVGIARSAREAMAMGIPTILVGHLAGSKGGNYGGIISDNNINDLEFCNLSGRNSPIMTTPELLASDILKLLNNNDLALNVSKFGRWYIENHCSSELICDQIERQLQLNS